MENERLTEGLGSMDVNQEPVPVDVELNTQEDGEINGQETIVTDKAVADAILIPPVPDEGIPSENIAEKDSDEIEPLKITNDGEEQISDSPESDTDIEDAGEEHEEEEYTDKGNRNKEHAEEEIDYFSKTREELLDAIKKLVHEDNLVKIRRPINTIKAAFDQLTSTVKTTALDQFKADGGEEDSFKYQPDGVEQDFYTNYQLFRDKKQSQFKNLLHQKEANLRVKNEILEELRNLVDGEEAVASLKIIKGIQEKWKSVGPIPQQHNRNLWANYNALMDRFYDKRGIYFELKELDRKKNLELKTEICLKAEALGIEDDISRAIHEMKHLHEEFKHIGPVPEKNQEELWIRFKAATDVVYLNRKDFVDELKDKQIDNFVLKRELCDGALILASFASDSVSDWNNKTRELLDIQKKWEAAGGVPRDKVKDLNKQFWSSFKVFFTNKSKFYKSIEGQREDNLRMKEEILGQVEVLKNSTDLYKAATEIKNLQTKWNDIGPIPEKNRKEIFKRFRVACDFFFNRRRESVKETEKEFYENLKLKQEICSQLEEMVNSDEIDLDIIDTLQTRFAQIGFVPRNELKEIGKRYDSILSKLTEKVNESDMKDKDQVAFEIQIKQDKGRPGTGRSIQKHESSIRRQISTIENNVSTWENNLEFFRDSKAADKFKKEFDLKIESANNELKQLRKQLRMMEEA